MGMKLIKYECVANAHRPTSNGADKLTIHEGAWAFCAFDALSDGHIWKHNEGEAFDTLLRHAGLSVYLDPHEIAAHARRPR